MFASLFQTLLLLHFLVFSWASETGHSSIEREVHRPARHPNVDQPIQQQHSGVGQPGRNVGLRQRRARLNRNESTASSRSQHVPSEALHNVQGPRGGNAPNASQQKQPIGDAAYRAGRVVEHLKNAGHNVGVATTYGIGLPVAGAIGAVVSAKKAVKHYQRGEQASGEAQAIAAVLRPMMGTTSGMAKSTYHTVSAVTDVGKAVKHTGNYLGDKKKFSGESDQQRLLRQRENGVKLERAKRRGAARRQYQKDDLKKDFSFFSGATDRYD